MSIQKPKVMILAGGASLRLGVPKGLYTWKNKPWLFAQVDLLREYSFENPILVAGAHADEYRAALQNYAIENITVVENSTWQHGPFSSVLAGIEACPRQNLIILPIDVPVPEAAIWTEFSSMPENIFAALPQHEGRSGYPMYLSKQFCEFLVTQPSNSRLDEQINALPPYRVKKIQTTDPRVLMNLSTKEDFERL